MRCKFCHELLALELGGDLDEHEQLAVQRHLAECPDCREQYGRLSASQAALQLAAVDSPLPRHPNLWPGLAKLIQPVRQAPVIIRHSANQFNGWIPALAMGVACLMILSFAGRQEREYAESQTVEFQPLITSPVHQTVPAAEVPSLSPGGSSHRPDVPVWDASLYSQPVSHPLQDDPRFIFVLP